MPGQVGLLNHGGLPKLLLKPGRYPGMPWRNWIARSYLGSKALSETVIEVSLRPIATSNRLKKESSSKV